MNKGAVYLLAIILGTSSAGCGTHTATLEDQFYQRSANAGKVPLKVALVVDQSFADQSLSLDPEAAQKVALQPAMTDAIKAALQQNFESVAVTNDATETKGADVLVSPSVYFLPFASRALKGGVDLTFSDPRTGKSIRDFHRETSQEEGLEGADVMLYGATGMSLFLLAPVTLPALAKRNVQAHKRLAQTILADNLDALAKDFRSSEVLDNLAKENGKMPAPTAEVTAPRTASMESKPAVIAVPKSSPPKPGVTYASNGHERRVALVIGNSRYKYVLPLDNPGNDAKLMADTLRKLHFELVGERAQIDLDKTGFDRAVQAFGNELHGSSVALFYYAGHGFQVRGLNYLVPISANPTKESDVDFQMVDAQLVLHQMEDSSARLNIMILDACRNNPFGGRGIRAVGGGLAEMVAPDGTLISLATDPGKTASDGYGKDSPYTEALAETLLEPGLGLFEVFNEVGVKVKNKTGGDQRPWMESSAIEGNFYFAAPPSK